MQDLGIDVLFKGQNLYRMIEGLLVALRISLISILISIFFGIIIGAFMLSKNRILKAGIRLYLETVRIMPQMVLL
ncbi:MAG: amino acid ABC transporter permease, partial [Lachnospiraceae bacterium]